MQSFLNHSGLQVNFPKHFDRVWMSGSPDKWGDKFRLLLYSSVISLFQIGCTHPRFLPNYSAKTQLVQDYALDIQNVWYGTRSSEDWFSSDVHTVFPVHPGCILQQFRERHFFILKDWLGMALSAKRNLHPKSNRAWKCALLSQSLSTTKEIKKTQRSSRKWVCLEIRTANKFRSVLSLSGMVHPKVNHCVLDMFVIQFFLKEGGRKRIGVLWKKCEEGDARFVNDILGCLRFLDANSSLVIWLLFSWIGKSEWPSDFTGVKCRVWNYIQLYFYLLGNPSQPGSLCFFSSCSIYHGSIPWF